VSELDSGKQIRGMSCVLTVCFVRGGASEVIAAVAREPNINSGGAAPNSDRTDWGERGILGASTS
jgi:hypothetical protein